MEAVAQMKIAIIAILAGLGVVLAGGGPVSSQTVPTDTQSWCGQSVPVVTATQLDPCTGSVPYFKDYLQALQSATPFKTWAKQNPGEWLRLQAYLASTAPWDGTNPKIASTKTFFGGSIRDMISICKITQCGIYSLPTPATIANDTQPPSVVVGITTTP